MTDATTDAQIFSIAQLESNCVAKKTKHRYHSTNFHFVLWLHEHHPDYVKVAVREAITTIKDQLRINTRISRMPSSAVSS